MSSNKLDLKVDRHVHFVIKTIQLMNIILSSYAQSSYIVGNISTRPNNQNFDAVFEDVHKNLFMKRFDFVNH